MAAAAEVAVIAADPGDEYDEYDEGDGDDDNDSDGYEEPTVRKTHNKAYISRVCKGIICRRSRLPPLVLHPPLPPSLSADLHPTILMAARW